MSGRQQNLTRQCRKFYILPISLRRGTQSESPGSISPSSMDLRQNNYFLKPSRFSPVTFLVTKDYGTKFDRLIVKVDEGNRFRSE